MAQLLFVPMHLSDFEGSQDCVPSLESENENTRKRESGLTIQRFLPLRIDLPWQCVNVKLIFILVVAARICPMRLPTVYHHRLHETLITNMLLHLESPDALCHTGTIRPGHELSARLIIRRGSWELSA